MRAASFKSLYQKRPAEDTRRALGCVSGRSRYSTKTFEDLQACCTEVAVWLRSMAHLLYSIGEI